MVPGIMTGWPVSRYIPGALFLALFLRLVTRRHGQSRLAGKLLHGLWKTHAVLFNEKGEMIARHAAAETMVAAAAIVGMEGRRFFAVKRATGPKIAALRLRLALVPCDTPPDDLGNRHPGANRIKECRWKAHSSS